MTPTPKHGDLPLNVLSSGGTVVVYDANGVEVVPFTDDDWRDSPPAETVPAMARVLKRAYESPAGLLEAHADWVKYHSENKQTLADGEAGPGWFDPEPLPPPPDDLDADEFDAELPLAVEIDADDWPADPDAPLDHEIRIEDARERVVYRVHADEYTTDPEQVAALITAIRLAYEAPLLLLSKPLE